MNGSCPACGMLCGDTCHRPSKSPKDAEIERLRAEVQELRLELIAAYGQMQDSD